MFRESVTRSMHLYRFPPRHLRGIPRPASVKVNSIQVHVLVKGAWHPWLDEHADLGECNRRRSPNQPRKKYNVAEILLHICKDR